MFAVIPPYNFHKLNLIPFLSLRGASATLFLGQSRPSSHILDCFAPLAMTVLAIIVICFSLPAFAGTSIPFTINLSKAVNVTGTPRIAVDVGEVTRYATYNSGSGTSALTFTYAMVAGDVDLDGVTVSSPIDLNGGTVKDLSGNDLSPLTFTPPNTINVKVNYPSLGMDFVADADGRYTLNGTVYNDLTSFLTAAGGTFSRASVGTYFDGAATLQTASSNVPRFDYDPITNAAKGILIEESRTNSFKGSSQLTSNLNGPAITLSSDVSTAPDGTTTADRLTATNVNNGYWAPSTVVNIAASTQYTISMYLKREAGGTTVKIGTANQFSNNTGDWTTTFDFTTNTFSSTNSNLSNLTYKNVGNGWIKLSFTATSAAGAVGGAPLIYSDTSSLTILVWGIQVEQGAFATSYIPTTTVAVTRAADVLTIPTGSWYNASTGTIMTQYSIPYMGGTGYPGSAVINDGTSNNGITLYVADVSGDLRRGQVKSGGTGSFEQAALSAYTAGTTTKSSLAYATNNANISMDGVLATTDTSVTVPTVTTLHVGGTSNAITSPLNGKVEKLKYYPSRIPDTQLQLLTQ